MSGFFSQKALSKRNSIAPEGALFVIINAQKALHYSDQRHRSNLKAEGNILDALKHWRKRKWPVLHIKHVSDSRSSLFYRKSEVIEFIGGFEPFGREMVIEKTKASAFVKTDFEKFVRKLKVPAIVLTGFTAGECIDATARHANDLEIRTIVIGDATATFDIVGPDGKLYKADKIHRSMLANIHANFADVISTSSAIL
jgi:nicotinamidase-related amidase